MATIQAQNAVELVDCGIPGIKEAHVLNRTTEALEWDRFMRLHHTAMQVDALNLPEKAVILDVGGFDGALALFLPKYRVWIVDPATTGASGTRIPVTDSSFDVVVSVDAIEHVERAERPAFVHELLRVCKRKLFINYPAARSLPIQEIALKLTGNKFIKEHVEYQLPNKDEVEQMIKDCDKRSISINTIEHTSISAWLPWYVLFQLDKKAGMSVANHMKARWQDTNAAPFLYDLICCTVG